LALQRAVDSELRKQWPRRYPEGGRRVIDAKQENEVSVKANAGFIGVKRSGRN
jgi:hypothetical protein